MIVIEATSLIVTMFNFLIFWYVVV
jgi:hypothetical protein